MQHFVKFKYVIFDMLTIMFDWVFRVRKIFDRSETLKDKTQQYEQKEQQANQKNERKKLSNRKLIWDLLYFHITTFPWKNI